MVSQQRIIINAKEAKITHVKLASFDIEKINLTFHGNDCLHAKATNVSRYACSTIEKVDNDTYLGVYVDFKRKINIENLRI